MQAAPCDDNDSDGVFSDVDCNDAAISCTDDCTTDADADGVADCEDLCIDADGDDYGSDQTTTVVGGGSISVGSCTTDGSTACSFADLVCLGLDCNDSDSSVNPAGTEVCN